MKRRPKEKTLPGYQDERYGVKGCLIKETTAGKALAELHRQLLIRQSSKSTPATKGPRHS
jgi:hypothetical protein